MINCCSPQCSWRHCVRLASIPITNVMFTAFLFTASVCFLAYSHPFSYFPLSLSLHSKPINKYEHTLGFCFEWPTPEFTGNMFNVTVRTRTLTTDDNTYLRSSWRTQRSLWVRLCRAAHGTWWRSAHTPAGSGGCWPGAWPWDTRESPPPTGTQSMSPATVTDRDTGEQQVNNRCTCMYVTSHCHTGEQQVYVHVRMYMYVCTCTYVHVRMRIKQAFLSFHLWGNSTFYQLILFY